MTFHNHHGLGDCWWHCLFLRKIGGSHVFYCKEQHHPDLRDLLRGHDVELRPIQDHPADSINCWIGAECSFSWHANLCERDLIGFLIGPWFTGLSQLIGVENPFKSREDLLLEDWDYCRFTSEIIPRPFIIDCPPTSGQVSKWNDAEHEALKNLRYCVYVIDGQHVRMKDVAVYSNHAPWIAGVATGPLWPCLNTSNKNKPIYILLDQVFLDYGPSMNIQHFPTVAEMKEQMRKDGWIE
jgi:hypothetical protein